MKCSRCGNRLVPIEKERTIEYRGRSVTIPARYLQCEGCGELLVDPRDSTNASQRAADQVRREEGLLTSAEIRAIREGIGLTQREFERLLRVGSNTVVRWEAGTVVQSPGMDDKIRGLRDVPAFAEYLADLRGVQLGGARASAQFTQHMNDVCALLFSSQSETPSLVEERITEHETRKTITVRRYAPPPLAHLA